MIVLTPDETLELDRRTIAAGTPGEVLMERAGTRIVAFLDSRFDLVEERIAVVCGKGNNGGDGFVAARVLREAGREVDALAVWPAETLQGDAAEMLARLPGAPPEPFEPGRLEGAQGIVDALLGTGTRGAPREPAAAVIEAINATGAPVIAADVPSGVDASTGEMRCTSGGALQGSSGAERSTPACESHDFADVTSRPGMRAPWLRANSPTTSLFDSSQGSPVAPAGKSCDPGMYRNDGNNSRGAVSPAATS